MPESMTGKKIALILCLFLSVSVAIAALWRTLLPEKYFLSVAAIMKNEKPYLKEWLEYHRLQGVEHFYLCDNGSTDGTKDYLQPYIQSGVITYIDFPGTNRQLACYDKIVKEYGEETSWLALIDLDEFLLPLQAKDMPSFLKEFADVNEVSLHWLNYGDNGLISRPGGLVTEAFTAHARFLNHTVKSIVRPEAVRRMSGFGDNHYVPVAGKSVNEYHKPVSYMLNFNISADKARVNHYIIKSFAEFINKKRRGHPEGTPIDYGYYFFHNENDITGDTAMQRFLPALKKRMEKSPLPDVALPLPADMPETYADFYFTPEEASQVSGRQIKEPVRYYDLQQAYNRRHHPSYLPQEQEREEP